MLFEDNIENDFYARGMAHTDRLGFGAHDTLYCGSMGVVCRCGWTARPNAREMQAFNLTPEMVERALENAWAEHDREKEREARYEALMAQMDF